MCLVVFAWKAHPEYRLVVAANRDEFHGRPARELHWWPDEPDILAGRDLQAGGTWLAVSKTGRFATVTNYREQQRARTGLRSRGELVTSFVAGGAEADSFVSSIEGNEYAGFSLLAADNDELCYVSNRGDDAVSLEPGVYGLSNASLDTPWSKLVRCREKLAQLIHSGDVNETSLLRMLGDKTTAPAAEVESDGIPFELARALTAPFIVSSDYGTRCSSTLLWSNSGQVSLTEKRFDETGSTNGESRFTFQAD